jgi:hypothetical protein
VLLRESRGDSRRACSYRRQTDQPIARDEPGPVRSTPVRVTLRRHHPLAESEREPEVRGAVRRRHAPAAVPTRRPRRRRDRPVGAQVPVTPAPVVPATPTTVLTATPAPTETPAAKPEVPRTPAPTATPAAPPPAVPTPTPAAAPRTGGIPPDLALGLLGGGAAALAGGLALLRRGRRAG